MNKTYKKACVLAVKILIAAALLAWVVSKTHWHDYVVTKEGEISVKDLRLTGAEEVRPGLATTLSRLKAFYLCLACAGFVSSLLIVGVRWWFLLRIQDIYIRLWEAIRLTFLGQFFNTVVPGTVGGDLVKAYYVFKHTPKKGAVLVSVFVDRVLGLTELTLLATIMLVGILVSGKATLDDPNMHNSAVAIGVVIAIVVGTMFFLFSPGFRKALHLQRLYHKLPVAHHIAAAGEAATLYRRRIGALLKAVAMTFGAHCLWVGSLALVGKSLNLSTQWYTYFVYIPLIYIIGAVPITPGGVGLIEQLYVAFFVTAAAAGTPGVTASEVLPFALLARLIPIFWGLPGILVAITGPRLPKADAIKAELKLPAENAG